MKVEDNILFAKRNLIDSIYRSANIEGIAITFPETQIICEGMSVKGHKIEDINAVNDLKHAWMYLLDNVDKIPNVEYISKLHYYLGKFTVVNSGCMRNVYSDSIRVAGTEWIPELPPKEDIMNEQIKVILGNKDKTQSALDMFCYFARGQFFLDGNKRLATLICNHVLIQNGKGIMSIPVSKKEDFYQLLIEFYETADKKKIQNFFKEYCIEVIKEAKEDSCTI